MDPLLEELSPSDAAQFREAIAQFNRQEFYACHDTLEALWVEAIEPQRTFYQGVLQLAVAYYHLLNGNWRGALILIGEGLSRLDYYVPDYLNIDVDSLVTSSQSNQQHLQELGAENLARFARDRIPQVQWIANDSHDL
ncbi:MAG: DUF309 domain-containing protein [Synechococcus sp.]